MGELEPVFASRPVLFGPRTENTRHAAEILEAVGAGVRVADADHLARSLIALLRDPHEALLVRDSAGGP